MRTVNDAIMRMASLYTGSSKVKVIDLVDRDDDGVVTSAGRMVSKVANMVKLTSDPGMLTVEYTNDDLYAELRVPHTEGLKTNERFSAVIPFAKLIKACALSRESEIKFRDTKNKLVMRLDGFTDKVSKSDEFFVHYDISAPSVKVCETDSETIEKCLALHACGGNRISPLKNRSESVLPALDNVALFHDTESLVGATSIADGGISMGKYKAESPIPPLLIPLAYCLPVSKFLSESNESVSIYKIGGRVGIQGEFFQLVIPQGSGQFPKLEQVISSKSYTDVFTMKRSTLIKYLSHLTTAYDNNSYVASSVVIVSHAGVHNVALSSIGELSETVIISDCPKPDGNFILTISLPVFIKLLKSMKGSIVTLSSEITNKVGIMSKMTCDDHTYFLTGIKGQSVLPHIEAVLQREGDKHD